MKAKVTYNVCTVRDLIYFTDFTVLAASKAEANRLAAAQRPGEKIVKNATQVQRTPEEIAEAEAKQKANLERWRAANPPHPAGHDHSC